MAYGVEKNAQRRDAMGNQKGEKGRKRERRREKRRRRAARGARESEKGKNERGGETGKRGRDTEGSNLVGEDCFHSGAQIEKERENRDAKAC